MLFIVEEINVFSGHFINASCVSTKTCYSMESVHPLFYLRLTYFFSIHFESYFVSRNINKEQMAVHTSVGIPGDRGLSSCPCGPVLALMWWTSVSVWNSSCCCLEPPGAGVGPPSLILRQLGFLRHLLLCRQARNISEQESLPHTEYTALV